jgi:hypothetical protein
MMPAIKISLTCPFCSSKITKLRNGASKGFNCPSCFKFFTPEENTISAAFEIAHLAFLKEKEIADDKEAEERRKSIEEEIARAQKTATLTFKKDPVFDARRQIEVKGVINVEPIGFQFVGEWGWRVRWMWQSGEDDEILMFSRRDCVELCGTLSGSHPNVKLVFDRNAIIHSYFNVFDPSSNTCVGTARCHKGTARKIMEKLINETP